MTQLLVLYTHMHAESWRHNKDERHSSKKNIPLPLFERFVCERELETEQNCNILTSQLLWPSAFLSRSQPEARGPSTLLGAVFLYHILSPNWSGLQNSIGDPEGPFCRVLFFSTASSLQTDWISCALSYIIVHAHSISPHNWPSEYALPPSLEWHVWIVIKRK